MQVQPEQDIWEWRPTGQCDGTERHPWVIYHSFNMRECAQCGLRESLWADFGIVKHTPQD